MTTKTYNTTAEQPTAHSRAHHRPVLEMVGVWMLTAADAREMADDIHGAWMNDILGVSWMADAHKLTAYADAVDAMTQPPRIEYETEEA